MRKHKRATGLAIIAAAFLIAAALFALFLPRQRTLVLTDTETGKVCLRLPVEDGEEFSVGYIHSVHQTPVIETYEVRGTDIYVTEARFYTFGAGMQSEYPEGVTVSYAEDGAIVASGYNMLCPQLIYCVGKVSDHTLIMGGEEYSLRGLCGRGALVSFTVE